MRRSVETDTGIDVLVWLKKSRPVSSFQVLLGLCLLDSLVGWRWGRRSMITDRMLVPLDCGDTSDLGSFARDRSRFLPWLSDQPNS